jgi:hypothetical protein
MARLSKALARLTSVCQAMTSVARIRGCLTCALDLTE